MVALAQGEPTEAEQLAHGSLASAVEQALAAHLHPALDVLAAVAAALESFEEAARILGAADRAREDLGRVRWPHEQEAVETLGERLRSELGAERFTAAITQGRALDTDQAIGWLGRTRGSRKRPSGGWESLTPTELQAVELAADGLTNPEIGERMFIARGTVKMHLRTSTRSSTFATALSWPRLSHGERVNEGHSGRQRRIAPMRRSS